MLTRPRTAGLVIAAVLTVAVASVVGRGEKASGASLSPDTRVRLLHIADRQARHNSDQHFRARAVRTTYTRAERAVLDSDSARTDIAPSAAVWIIELQGVFVHGFRHPWGVPAPRGTVLTLIVTADEYVMTDLALNDTRHRLKDLGSVVVLR